MKWTYSDKYTALKNDLFLDREIRGLFGYRGGLQDVNIGSEKMLKFRRRVYRSRKTIFTQLVRNIMREETKKGRSIDREDAEERAYIEFIDLADQMDLVITQNRFHDLYPQDSRKKLSW